MDASSTHRENRGFCRRDSRLGFPGAGGQDAAAVQSSQQQPQVISQRAAGFAGRVDLQKRRPIRNGPSATARPRQPPHTGVPCLGLARKGKSSPAWPQSDCTPGTESHHPAGRAARSPNHQTPEPSRPRCQVCQQVPGDGRAAHTPNYQPPYPGPNRGVAQTADLVPNPGGSSRAGSAAGAAARRDPTRLKSLRRSNAPPVSRTDRPLFVAPAAGCPGPACPVVVLSLSGNGSPRNADGATFHVNEAKPGSGVPSGAIPQLKDGSQPPIPGLAKGRLRPPNPVRTPGPVPPEALRRQPVKSLGTGPVGQTPTVQIFAVQLFHRPQRLARDPALPADFDNGFGNPVREVLQRNPAFPRSAA